MTFLTDLVISISDYIRSHACMSSIALHARGFELLIIVIENCYIGAETRDKKRENG